MDVLAQYVYIAYIAYVNHNNVNEAISSHFQTATLLCLCVCVISRHLRWMIFMHVHDFIDSVTCNAIPEYYYYYYYYYYCY